VYYRWTDASGTPVNSDRPPPAGVKYDVITTNTNRMVDGGRPEAGMPEEANEDPENAAAEKNTPAQTTASTKDPEACATARKNLETLNTHARIRVPDGNGNFRFIDAEEKAQQRENSEAAVAYYCE
tara:strand:+ start:63108 stop:63485 length:378 start_codon:yes stop_codon:yes gene_type:complete